MPAKAMLLPGPLGPPLRFEVSANGAVWRFDVAFDGERPALFRPELIEDGEPDDAVRVGGYAPAVPVEAAQLAIEAEMRRLWQDDGDRLPLTSAGFRDPPAERRSTAGRPRTRSDVLVAVDVRRALKVTHRAPYEKLLSEARHRGVLHRRPRPREFTFYGTLLLRHADRAKEQLLELLDECGGTADVEEFAPRIAGPPDAKRAAIEDLRQEGEIRIVRLAHDDERKRHGYAEAEIARTLGGD